MKYIDQESLERVLDSFIYNAQDRLNNVTNIETRHYLEGRLLAFKEVKTSLDAIIGTNL